jgi:hypothetical protein
MHGLTKKNAGIGKSDAILGIPPGFQGKVEILSVSKRSQGKMMYFEGG